MRCLAYFFVIGVFACFSPVSAASLILAREGRSDYVILIPEKSSQIETTAAVELRDHLEQVTGARLEIVSEGDSAPDRRAILVGATDRTRKLLPDVDLTALSQDAILVKTVGDDLMLAGHPRRGTLYAVYTFLEETVGCRWWTAEEGFVPKKPTLVIPALDVVYSPKIKSREAFYRDFHDGDVADGVFAARCKLNGHFTRIPSRYGGHEPFAGFVHTFHPLLPPDKYFAAHPEWYSLIDGKRTRSWAQLCLTNDSMREELTRNALALLKQMPDARIISISQNDCFNNCQCEKCKAVDQEEGSPAGLMLRFVNAVAAEIEKTHPDVLVETLAYQYTRTPPRFARPRENVVVRLCSIECSFSQTLAKGPQNEPFRRDIEGWSRIAPRLYVWDYVTNFQAYILPHPNLRVLAPNIRYFVDNGVVGLFEQGDYGCRVGDFVRLRAWLLAHLMWNPDRDENELIAEFLEGYYGKAAPHLLAYLNTINDAGQRTGVYLRCFMPDTSGWFSLEDLNTTTRHFEKALTAVADDPVLVRRVRRERLPLDNAWLQRYYFLSRLARINEEPFAGPADPEAACREFIELANEHDAGQWSEGRPFAEYETRLRVLFRPAGSPPKECEGLAASLWIDIQDNQFNLARPGQWAAVVDDPKASDAKAVRMPGDHFEWATSIPVSADLACDTPWRCYMVVRVKATAKEGPAMTLGIYDPRENRGVVSREISVAQMDDDYQTIDLGTHVLQEGMYLWAAPPKRPGEVQAVFVDRVFLIRDE